MECDDACCLQITVSAGTLGARILVSLACRSVIHSSRITERATACSSATHMTAFRQVRGVTSCEHHANAHPPHMPRSEGPAADCSVLAYATVLLCFVDTQPVSGLNLSLWCCRISVLYQSGGRTSATARSSSSA